VAERSRSRYHGRDANEPRGSNYVYLFVQDQSSSTSANAKYECLQGSTTRRKHGQSEGRSVSTRFESSKIFWNAPRLVKMPRNAPRLFWNAPCLVEISRHAFWNAQARLDVKDQQHVKKGMNEEYRAAASRRKFSYACLHSNGGVCGSLSRQWRPSDGGRCTRFGLL
jgi:hypothetical protein